MEADTRRIEVVAREGFKPGVVMALLNGGSTAFFYSSEYELWGLPQGGIKKGEEFTAAIMRNLSEDVGEELIGGLDLRFVYLGEDRIEFPPGKGEAGFLGKHYFLFAINCFDRRIDLLPSIYSQARWVSYRGAEELIKRIYQPGKARMTKKVVEALSDRELLTRGEEEG